MRTSIISIMLAAIVTARQGQAGDATPNSRLDLRIHQFRDVFEA